MHAVFFGVKRAHLEVVWRLTGPLIEKSGLTPARFDLMRIVRLRPHGVPQGTLHWLLGVSPPTVSRMLKSLEELGWIRRVEHRRDRRSRVVHITESGTAAVEMALAATVGSREAEHHVARVATGDRTRRSGGRQDAAAIKGAIEAAKAKVVALEGTLARMRSALFDFAPFVHPWRATDEDFHVHTIVDGCLHYGNEVVRIDPKWILAQAVAEAEAEADTNNTNTEH
jgi:DNA-binding MarR family transcriptional regulator